MRIFRLGEEECFGVLARMGVGRLACARDNQPYVVPAYFAVSGHAIYSFALPGQKIRWMRENPKICLEVDEVTARDDWTSVIVMGRYQELAEGIDFQSERALAQHLFQRRPMWWEPGATSLENHDGSGGYRPIVYQMVVASVSGYRAAPAVVGGAR